MRPKKKGKTAQTGRLEVVLITKGGHETDDNEATLAARIARAWAKLDFEPLPLAPSRQDTTAKRSKDSKKKQAKRSSEGGSEKTTETTQTVNVAVPRKKKQKVASAEKSSV